MKKQIILENYEDCPYRQLGFCSLLRNVRECKSTKNFPDWCPLEDAE